MCLPAAATRLLDADNPAQDISDPGPKQSPSEAPDSVFRGYRG
jgi:hypothetical protein